MSKTREENHAVKKKLYLNFNNCKKKRPLNLSCEGRKEVGDYNVAERFINN